MFYLEYYSFLFLTLVLLSSLLVILSKNPILSVFFLILSFIFSSLLLILFGVEFIAVVILTVYVGAIAVLFLFVVMLLNLRIVELYSMFFSYFSVGWFIFFFALLVFFLIFALDYGFFKSLFFLDDDFFDQILLLGYSYNISYLGNVLYNYYGHFVILAALVLLLAMLASIVLTVDFSYREENKLAFYNKLNTGELSISFLKF